MGAEHSKVFSPSSAARRIACPGSARMEATAPDIPSRYAEEGSAAHCLAQTCLTTGKLASSFLGQWVVQVGHGLHWSVQRGRDGFRPPDGFEVDPDMVIAVQVYLDYIAALRQPGDTMMVEQRVTVNEDVFGTADNIIAVPFGPLDVTDFKYGRGVMVLPDWNPQTLTYALGAVYASPHDHDVVRNHIVQPRTRVGPPTRTWSLPVPELYKWRDEVLLPAVARCKAPDAPLAAGDHCRFCNAAGGCPELNKTSMAALQVVETPTGSALPVPAMLTNEQIGRILSLEPMVLSWLKEVGSLAHRKLEQGEQIPGQKLVRGRANRAWTDEAYAETYLAQALGPDAYNRKTLSPNQAEQAFKVRGFDPKVLSPIITKPEGPVTLAPADDPRPALPASAARAFDPIDIG